jgi:hypothetical protein
MHEFTSTQFTYKDASALFDEVKRSDIPDDAQSILLHQISNSKACAKRADDATTWALNELETAAAMLSEGHDNGEYLTKASKACQKAAGFRNQSNLKYESALRMFLALTGRTS